MTTKSNTNDDLPLSGANFPIAVPETEAQALALDMWRKATPEQRRELLLEMSVWGC